MEPTLDTIVTIGAAILLFWRLHASTDAVRKELKADILRVEKKSEDAHKEIRNRLGDIEKQQVAHTERLNFFEKYLNVSGRGNSG